MTDHTPISQVSRLDVISTGARRRWTLAEKQRIVAESYGAPRLVSATARRNGLSVSQLFTWRRLAREGRLVDADYAATFVQAVIGCGPLTSGVASLAEHVEAAAENSPCSPRPAVAPGRIEIMLMCGRRVVVDNDFDSAALARVLAVLGPP
jgi:transposase